MERAEIIWAVVGIVLILAEFLVPGLVVVFLGMSALLVAIGIYLGWLVGWMNIMVFWFISSIFLIMTLRGLFARFAPGNIERPNVDEDLEAIGSIVEVVADVSEENENGRIYHRGTYWSAKAIGAKIRKGEKARLLSRQVGCWLVERVLEEDSREETDRE